MADRGHQMVAGDWGRHRRKKGVPRDASTYRGARRNAVRARRAQQLAVKRAAPGYVDHHKRQSTAELF
jgi:hypothetical protein